MATEDPGAGQSTDTVSDGSGSSSDGDSPVCGSEAVGTVLGQERGDARLPEPGPGCARPLCPTHPSVGLAFPPALVPADAAVDLHHIALPQRELPHVPGSEVVPGHGRADDTGCEHCWGRWAGSHSGRRGQAWTPGA